MDGSTCLAPLDRFSKSVLHHCLGFSPTRRCRIGVRALAASQAAQDPTVELKGKPFTTEYYGVAMNK
ncbi:hypothetical protein ACWDAZ_35430, partial [Streptomyces sp. NPDC001215]